MKPWDLVDEAPVPNDDGTLYLLRRGRSWSIHVEERELMSNREHGSEDALADLACDRLVDRSAARVLVGGLGMGFTLAAALRRVGAEAVVTVAELIPAVVRWNLAYTGDAAGHPLRDPRTVVFEGDVCELLEGGGPWDAILLDVDNGPRAPTRPGNGWLYTRQGLKAIRMALSPGGVLGVWSSSPDDGFTQRLRDAGFAAESMSHTEPGRPTGDGTGTHFLWMGSKAST